MQRVRLTYKGALHHALSRGHGGKKIFSDSRLKETFSDLLAETSRKLRIIKSTEGDRLKIRPFCFS
jgi:hypothetical protein